LRFDNEAPRIGCGVRGIIVRKRGRKWVYIAETATGYTAKLSVRTFDEMVRAAQ
jgi:hypothetical protein